VNELKKIAERLEQIAESCPHDEIQAEIETAYTHLTQAINLLQELADGPDTE